MFRELTFPALVRFSGAGYRPTRRATDRGRLLQTAAVVCAALGVDTDLTLIYQMFALLFCAILASRLTLAIRRPSVAVRRRLPRYATANEMFEYYIDITNTGDDVERDLVLADNPSVVAPTIEQFQRSREPGEESRNAYDRWLGFHRYMWLQRLNTGIAMRRATAPDVPIKSRVSARVEALPLRRGVVHLESISVMHPDPLGLNYGVAIFDAPEQLLVLPRRYAIPAHFELPGGRHFQPGGVNAAWSIGESDEFVSLRDYRDGDSLRKIHWPSTAKRSKPVVREYQDEYFVRQALILDTTAERDDALEEAVSVAASFVLRMTDTDAVLDLVYLGTKPEVITSGRGSTSVTHQLEALAGLKRTTLPVDDLAEAVVRSAPLLSGGIFVLTDWSEVRRSMVDTLAKRGIPLEVFVIGSPEAFPDLPAFVRLLTPGKIAEGLARL